MGKIILTLIFLTITSMSYAQEIISVPKVSYKTQNKVVTVQTKCIKGYLFAIVISNSGHVSITQIMMTFGGNSSAPLRCK